MNTSSEVTHKEFNRTRMSQETSPGKGTTHLHASKLNKPLMQFYLPVFPRFLAYQLITKKPGCLGKEKKKEKKKRETKENQGKTNLHF